MYEEMYTNVTSQTLRVVHFKLILHVMGTHCAVAYYNFPLNIAAKVVNARPPFAWRKHCIFTTTVTNSLKRKFNNLFIKLSYENSNICVHESRKK